MTKTYLIDTDIFIAAKNTYYAFDIAPGFWDVLIMHAENGFVKSIDRVGKEIKKGKDELTDWVDKHNFPFDSTNETSIAEQFGELMKWVYANGNHYKEYAISKFAGDADGWLIAYAKVKNCVVVTNEVINREQKKEVPIPNVCEQFCVEYVNTFQMLRGLNVKLIKERNEDNDQQYTE